MPGCAHCGTALEIVGNQVGRRDTCPGCGEELRSCRNCRHFEPAAAKGCKEPFSEVPADKDAANFCEYFQISEGGRGGREARETLLAAAEGLFQKK